MLENKYLLNPAEFEKLYSLVRVEVEAKKADDSSSCTNGLLWLTRAMGFIVELFRNLMEHKDWSMSQVCSEAHTKTLYHGWLASSTFMLAPDRKKFMDVVGGKCDISSDIEKFCATFTPLLEESHKFLMHKVQANEKSATLKLPYGEVRLISKNCSAAVGQVRNIGVDQKRLGTSANIQEDKGTQNDKRCKIYSKIKNLHRRKPPFLYSTP